MTFLIHRWIDFTRLTGFRPERLRFAVRAEVRHGETAIRFTAPPAEEAASEAADRAAQLWEQWSASVPAGDRAELVTERGVVRTTYQAGGRMVACREVVFELVRSGAALLWLGRPGDAPQPPVLLGEAGGNDLADQPVVIAPSAVLALVSGLLDRSGARASDLWWVAASNLTVIDTPDSPHPAHDLSAVPPVFAPERVVVADGRLCDAWEVPARHDPMRFLVLARTEDWLRPLGAVENPARRNLRVEYAAAAPPTHERLTLQTLTPLTAQLEGMVEWEATYTLDGAAGWRVGSAPLRFSSPASAILGAITGATARPAPGLELDPVAGPVFGWAPALATRLTARRLLAPEGLA